MNREKLLLMPSYAVLPLLVALSPNTTGEKFVHWLEQIPSRTAWIGLFAITVIVSALLMYLGRRSWERRLNRWAADRGYLLLSFSRARDPQRVRMVSAFGEWDSDWLEVFEVVVETQDKNSRAGLVAFKSWLGLGPYRFRDVRWID